MPFTDVLAEKTVKQALKTANGTWLDRVYPPLATLSVFLGQVLRQDHLCRAAAARLIAPRVSRVPSPWAAETGAYCQARKRLPEKFFSCVARLVGKAIDDQVDPAWLAKEDLARRYRNRWSQELAIRDITISLQMDILRCKTPELVRQEIWTHILAYNLIRSKRKRNPRKSEMMTQPRWELKRLMRNGVREI